MQTLINHLREGQCADICNITANLWNNKFPARCHGIISCIFQLIPQLAKTFDHENGYSFVNGILGNVVASLGIGESDKEGKAEEPNDNE